MRRLFDRARDAGCSAVVITLDLQIMGQRHMDLKNGLSAPPKFTLASMANLATKWPWGIEMLQTKRRFFGNIVGHAKGVSDPSSLASWTAEAFDHALDWDRVAELMKMWGGPVILKGILDADDARKAAELGAAAIIVSNHGGRQFDGAPAALTVLPAIAQAVSKDCAILYDSGVRSGLDIARALALGADFVLLGRAFMFGVAALGEENE